MAVHSEREIIRIDRLLRIRRLFPTTISVLVSLLHSLSPLRSYSRCENPTLNARAPKLHAFFGEISLPLIEM